MFENEARFERVKDPRRCWAPPGLQPEVPVQIVREYKYLFGAVSSHDGALNSLIPPEVNAETMSLFLARVAERHPQDYILMVLDGAGRHRAQGLSIPLRPRPGRPPKLARRQLSQLPRWLAQGAEAQGFSSASGLSSAWPI